MKTDDRPVAVGDAVLVKRLVKRIGVLRLWRHPDAWWVTLDNRSYHHAHQIQPEKLASWRKEFGLP